MHTYMLAMFVYLCVYANQVMSVPVDTKVLEHNLRLTAPHFVKTVSTLICLLVIKI